MRMAMEGDAGRGYCYARKESTLKHVLYGGNFLTRPPNGTSRHAISPGEGYLLTRIQQGGSRGLHCTHRGAPALPSSPSRAG